MKDEVVAAVASKGTYGGSVAAVFGWLAQSDVAVAIGVIVAVAGFATNWAFQHRRNCREAEQHEWRRREHESRMRELRDDCGDP